MKILVRFKNNNLYFQSKKKLSLEYKNLLNTNIINNSELLFSQEYINENQKIIVSFLNEIIKSNNIDTINFQSMDVASVIMPFIHKLNNIESILFQSSETFPYSYLERIIKSKSVKYINSEYIPQYIIEEFENNKIIAESRDEVLFSSNFMELNNLTNYYNILYKRTIYLEFPLSEQDTEDITSFFKINKYIRKIHINIPNKYNLEEVITLLKKYKHKNILIIIHGDVHDRELVEYLHKNNKRNAKKYKIKLKLKYTEEYIIKNITKETNNNILKACGMLVIGIALFAISFILYDNYTSMLKVSKIQEEIQEYIKTSENETPKEEIEQPQETTPSNELIVKNDYIQALKSINPDIVGWLKVNNTNIDYAVTQTTNNEYYLDHNLYKEADDNGWVFMDSENDSKYLNDNTVLYGHNRYVNGVIFGTLNNVLTKNWYLNEENQIITLSTMYKTYKFKIFSIYVVNTTSDYIITSFANAEKKQKFLDTIISRSINDFGITPTTDDKILTLSTCKSNTSRLAVHAVLIEEN